MGKRIGFAVAAIIVVIVVAAAVAPYFVGVAAESNFKARIAELNIRLADRGLSLHVDSYHRGFYGSGADISLIAAPRLMSEDMAKAWKTLFGAKGNPVFHLHISHGPIPFDAFGYGHWNFMPVLYTAEFQGKRLPADSLVGALKPDIYVVQYFGGSTHARLTVPPGHKAHDGDKAKWQGGYLSVEMNAPRDRGHFEGVLKSIEFRSLDADTKHEYSGNFDGLKFSGSSRKAEHGFWVGPSRFTMDGLSVSKDGTQIANFISARAQGKTSETSNGQWWNADAQIEFDGGTFQGLKFSKYTLGYDFSKLDAQGLRQALDAARKRSANASGEEDEEASQVMGGMLPLFALAIKPDTTASLNLALAAPSGSASLGAHIEFVASAAVEAGGARNLMRNANVEIQLDFDRKLVDDFYTTVLGAPSADGLNRKIQSLVDVGYLLKKGGRYHSTIRYNAGRITVNGKPFQMVRATHAALGPASAVSPHSAPAPASG